jgi:hypothetical protein
VDTRCRLEPTRVNRSHGQSPHDLCIGIASDASGLRPGADTDELADRFYSLLLDGIRGYAMWPEPTPVNRIGIASDASGLRPSADTDELADRFCTLLLEGIRGYATR